MDQEGQGLQQQLHQIQRGIQAESERCRVLKVGSFPERRQLLLMMSLLRAVVGAHESADTVVEDMHCGRWSAAWWTVRIPSCARMQLPCPHGGCKQVSPPCHIQ